MALASLSAVSAQSAVAAVGPVLLLLDLYLYWLHARLKFKVAAGAVRVLLAAARDNATCLAVSVLALLFATSLGHCTAFPSAASTLAGNGTLGGFASSSVPPPLFTGGSAQEAERDVPVELRVVLQTHAPQAPKPRHVRWQRADEVVVVQLEANTMLSS